ncbi:polysaccharide deacetylase family protein [Sediminibacterium ginsengisoli]|uniref:Peptidoglycan/xylan/chitin deacetylase, PgdA/CDA1 family n=1 Tax=Sediminibacterium ginsengisoli TaxID=413434 RepID=A0A1T4NKA6_9BACT|nr:polysaccharide deacetylase family protein [Sediminibacterium ginsengisoli]SJZ79700.1 Peptidoglycan/xylan/chitin deacetylase, PgdA/CDA1 family [Sediminibacterium ginsengisoli]
MLSKPARACLRLLALAPVFLTAACNFSSNASPGLPEDTAETAGKPDVVKPSPLADWQPITYDSSKKYIYLTFDDGPQHGTMDCYNVCKKLDVKASFFMVGLHSEAKSDGRQIVHTIRESYPQFLLANHSYTHASGNYKAFYKNSESTILDFDKAQQQMKVPYLIARLPGNSAWVRNGELRSSPMVRKVTELLDSAGYNVFGWEVEWNFNHKSARPVQTPQQLANQVDSAFARNRTHTPNHVVILTHDRMFRRPEDTDSLAKFISILKQNPAYVFETVDHYPGIKRPVYKP